MKTSYGEIDLNNLESVSSHYKIAQGLMHVAEEAETESDDGNLSSVKAQALLVEAVALLGLATLAKQ